MSWTDREPVLARFIIALVALLGAFGIQVDEFWVDLALDVLAFGVLVLSALSARSKVTPVADPKDDDGKALTPAA